MRCCDGVNLKDFPIACKLVDFRISIARYYRCVSGCQKSRTCAARATRTKLAHCPVIFRYRSDSRRLFSRSAPNLEIHLNLDIRSDLEIRSDSRESAFAYMSARLYSHFPARRTRYGTRPVPYGPVAVPAVATQPYRYGPRAVPRSIWRSRRTRRLMGTGPYFMADHGIPR